MTFKWLDLTIASNKWLKYSIKSNRIIALLPLKRPKLLYNYFLMKIMIQLNLGTLDIHGPTWKKFH